MRDSQSTTPKLSQWKRMSLVFFLGFSSGLPLLLIGGTLKQWLARDGIDVKTIGYFSWVGMAYSMKFLWAPLLDRFSLFGWGRRRSWMISTQVALAGLLIYLGTLNPLGSLFQMAMISVVIAFFSATQDSVIDAYRREILPDAELGIGSTVSTYGYRIAMLLSGGLGIGLVGSDFFNITWGQLYVAMGALMAVGGITTWLAPEPFVDVPPPRSLAEAVVQPFVEFLSRPNALLLLVFVICFKLGDAISGAMLNKFYVDMMYTNQDIGFIAKTVGLISSLIGLAMGGFLIMKLGVFRSLIAFGLLQAFSTALFALITFTGPERWALGVVVVFEDISSGMGTSAFLAFMATLTNKRFTATQYALLASLASVGRNFFSGFSGVMVENMGWANFFYSCALIAIPGILLSFYLRRLVTANTSSASSVGT